MTRKATRQDFDFIYSLYMNPQVNPFLLYEMMDAETFKPIFKELLSKKVLYIFEDQNKGVGMFKLIPLTFRNTHVAYLGGVAIDSLCAGKGYGLKMLKEIIDYAKNKGFLRIELSVADYNEKAIHLYEKAGFKKEGLLVNYTYLKKENRFINEVMMAWIKE
ncbi:MAG TPA: GNAT family protein [Panacibacter sp.]|nr:GNAT family protein [Panacibacter sp.]